MIELLYKRKIIRDFLSLFSDSKWNQLIIHTLEFGILQLKQKNNLASLSIDDIINLVDEMKELDSKEDSKKIMESIKMKKKIDSDCEETKFSRNNAKRDHSKSSKLKRSTSKRVNSSLSNHSILDTSMKNDLDQKFKSGKNKLNSSKLNDSINKSLKHDSSSKKILKNNLKKINEKSNSKLHKESYNSKVANDVEKTLLKSNIQREKPQNGKEKIGNISKINLTKKKSSVESKITQIQNKEFNLFDKGREKESQKIIKTTNSTYSKNRNPSSNKTNNTLNTKLNTNSNLVKSINENKCKTDKTNTLKETKVKIYFIQVESKIKTIIEKDKKIYNILKKNNFENEDIQVYSQEKQVYNNHLIQEKETSYYPEEVKNNKQNDKSYNLVDSDLSNLNLNEDKSVIQEKKRNYMIEFDKNMEIQNVEEKREEKIKIKDKQAFKNIMNMTLAKKKETVKQNLQESGSDTNSQNVTNNYLTNNQYKNNSENKKPYINKIDDLIEEDNINHLEKMKSESSTANKLIYSSNNESEDSIYQYNTEIQSKKVNVGSGVNIKYNINENYNKNIQQLKKEMNMSDGENEENISTRDKNMAEMSDSRRKDNNNKYLDKFAKTANFNNQKTKVNNANNHSLNDEDYIPEDQIDLDD